MDQKVIERRVEDGTLVGRSTFDFYDTQSLLPAILCRAADGGEVQRGLLCREVQQGILFADEGDARLDVKRLSWLGVKGEPYAYIITADSLTVGRVDLVLTVVVIPFRFYPFHSGLLLPVARFRCAATDADGEVLVEDGLRGVAEGAHQLASYYGRIIEEAYGSPTFVCES